MTGGHPPSRPASPGRAALAQAAMELRLTARRGENLLVMIVIPAALLLFFGSVPLVPTGTGRPVDFLLPGVLALALVSTGLVNLGIATAYERSYGVLKRLGGSPLGRGGLVAAKLAAIGVVEAVQLVLLVAVAAGLLGWAPGAGASLPLATGALLLGSLAFAGLGLAMAGAFRAEATLAGANALFLVLLLLGGVVVPIERLPGALGALAGLLPLAPLSELLRIALGAAAGSDPLGPAVVLGAWAAGAILVATRSFRWE